MILLARRQAGPPVDAILTRLHAGHCRGRANPQGPVVRPSINAKLTEWLHGSVVNKTWHAPAHTSSGQLQPSLAGAFERRADS